MSNKMKIHKDLDVWKKSVSLVTLIYEVTKAFPKDGVYGITNQIKRSAASIPSKIEEGSARQGHKEFVQFLYISLSRLAELETQLNISTNLKYVTLNDDGKIGRNKKDANRFD